MKSAKDDNSVDAGIGRGIREWRTLRGLLQKQLARAAGMEVAQLCAIENDRNSPSVKTLARIAAALDLSLAELLSPPGGEGDRARPAAGKRVAPQIVEAGLVRIMRPAEGERGFSKADLRRMERSIDKSFMLESERQIDIPATLPLAFPVAVNESGAEQLASILRAHLDVGSAVVHDVRALFECHGIRIIEGAALPRKTLSATFYSPARRNYTVFLSKELETSRSRRDFNFLAEIGRAAIFASRGLQPFTNSATSRRFAHHFAASFLQPETAVRTAVYSLRVRPDDWTLELLLRLKERFGVSAESFNIRLKELGLISQGKSAGFAAAIKEHYGQTGHGEPMPDGGLAPNRIGDLEALGRIG